LVYCNVVFSARIKWLFCHLILKTKLLTTS
jgi:hypothetical protein